MNIKLGVRARDKVTEFEGAVTAHCRYLTGCDQYLLAPSVDKEGKHVEARWFDANRIDVVKKETVKLYTTRKKGACEQAPIK